MSVVHKARIVLSRWAANSTGKHSDYDLCYCDYGKDHDDFRSISAQSKEVSQSFGEPMNDMLAVARRETWSFSPGELKNIRHWLFSAGEYDPKIKKLLPVPFADEIWRLVSQGGQESE